MKQNLSGPELKYLRVLGERYPTIEALCTESPVCGRQIKTFTRAYVATGMSADT